MPEERIRIYVSESGSRTVARNIDSIGKSASSTDKALKLVRTSLTLLAGSVILRGLSNLADTFTNIENRLKLVTTSAQNLVDVNNELFEIANRTRNEYETTAQVYARTALATKNLGISQRDTLKFTESLNKAVILSGAASQEARNAIIQLSQGMASNTLRGDELRAVLEQLPLVADVISEHLGVTRGQLRELGTQGLISAQVVVDAFLAASDKLDGQFAETIPTIGQSMAVLRNVFIRFIGDLNDSTGVLDTISKAILGLAMNFDTFAKSVLAASIFLSVNFARQAIPEAISKIKLLWLVIRANPLGILLTILTAVISVMTAFRNDIQLSSDKVTTFGDVFKATGIVIKEYVQLLGPVFEEIQRVVGETSQTFLGFVPTLRDVLMFFAYFADEGIRIFSRFKILMTTGMELLWAELPGPVRNGISLVLDLMEGFMDRIAASFLATVDTVKNIASSMELVFYDLGLAAKLAIQGNFEAAKQASTRANQELARANISVLDEFGKNYSSRLETMTNTRLLPKITEVTESMVQEIRDRMDKELGDVEGLTFFSGVLEEILTLADAIGAKRTNEESLVTESTITNVNEMVERLTYGQKIMEGFRDGFKNVQLELENISDIAANTMTDAFKSAEDAFVEFTRTGEFNFRSMVESIQANLAKLVFREGLQALIGGATGGGGGGFLTSLFSGLTLAQGGRYGKDDVVAVGGRDPEIIAPDSSGEVFPLRKLMQGQQAPQAPKVGVTVINVSSQEQAESVAASRRAGGDEVIMNFITENKNTIKEILG